MIIPTFNRIDGVHTAVKSVTEQTYPHIEIIVVDDGSTDPRAANLQTTLAEVVGTRCPFKFIRLPENLRKIYNKRHSDPPCQGLVRNRGIEVAEGMWVAFLDDDDAYIDNHKLEKQLHAMHTRRIPFCVTNMTYGYALHQQTPLPLILKKKDIMKQNFIPMSTTIVRKDLLERVGMHRHVHAEDWDLWLRVMDHTDCIYLRDVTVLYDTKSTKYYRIHKF